MSSTFNINAFRNTIGTTVHSMPIVILYVTEACNLQCAMCSYRSRLPNELSLDEIRTLAISLKEFGLQHIVFSGGEPLLRIDFPQICELFKGLGIRQTLLTNGLLIAKRVNDLPEYFSEIVVSLDGADAATHNLIRGVESFDQILKGITVWRAVPERPSLSIRSVIQKQNFRQISALVDLAVSAGADRISFLSADVHSEAFGREHGQEVIAQDSIALDQSDVKEFRAIVGRMVASRKDDFGRIISDPPRKLFHLVEYYEAILGLSPFPRNRCNAPMVSTVITSTGAVHPCFFLPTFGNIRQDSLPDLLNRNEVLATRTSVRDYTLDHCRKCVCTLYSSPTAAFKNKF